MSRSVLRVRYNVGDHVTFVGAGPGSYRGRPGQLLAERNIAGLRWWKVALLDTGTPPKTEWMLARAFAPAGPHDGSWLRPGARVLASFSTGYGGPVRAPGTVVDFTPRLWMFWRNRWKVRWDTPGTRWSSKSTWLPAYSLSPLRPLTPDPYLPERQS